MRSFPGLAVALFATVLLDAQGGRLAAGQAAAPAKPLSEVAFFDHTKVADALAKGTKLLATSELTVLGSHREVAGEVEVHDHEIDVIYFLEGEATFVTGGTMVGGRVSAPGQHLGKNITGGQTHRLTKGDVVVVPAGVPHWFKEVKPQATYYVVKVIKP
jgi:quercetin dioxygenase-like cupin family protein